MSEGEGGGAATSAPAEASSGDAASRISAILAATLAECPAEEREYTQTLVDALTKDEVEVEAAQKYLPLAFVRGFIYDSYKDKEDKVDRTLVELKEALEFRKHIRTQFGILEPPEVQAAFEQYMHSFIPDDGSDFEGHPLWILDLPSPGFQEHLTKEQILAYHARDQEKMERLKLEASLERGAAVFGCEVIVDMLHSKGGLGGAIAVARKMNEILTLTAKDGNEKNMDSFYYPESMHAALILNSPWWFQGLWKVVSLFLEPSTRQKVKVLGSDYTEVLFERGLLGFLPRYLGGCSPNPTALSMREFGEGIDVVGKVGKDGSPAGPLEVFVTSGSGQKSVRVCFPKTHAVQWKVTVKARKLVLTVNGHVRHHNSNETQCLCEATKFEEGTILTGSFDRTGGQWGRGGDASGGGGGGGGGGKCSIAEPEDVHHGFLVLQLAGSSSLRSTTVAVSVELVALAQAE